jgi:hypothetical protein
MNWLKMVTKRKNRNVTLSIIGLAVGATALSMARRRNNRRSIMSPLRRIFG